MTATLRRQGSPSSAALAREDDRKRIEAIDPFRRLDLVDLFLPAIPMLREGSIDWHPDRELHITRIASHDPSVRRIIGLTEQRWSMTYEARRFWRAWLETAPAMISAETRSDGGVREILTPAAVRSQWLRIRQEVLGGNDASGWTMQADDLPVWTAALLAHLTYDGRAWVRSIDGCMVRDLPPWPLRLPTDRAMIEVRDVVHHVLSAVILPGRMATDGKAAILHLSVVGHASKHRSLWAAMLNRRREAIRIRVCGEWHAAVRVDGRNQYVTDWNDQPLPESGLAHMALTHRSAFEPHLGQDFLHLSGNDLTGAPDLALFAQQIDRAISLPFDRSLAARLWEVGRRAGTGQGPLITPLPSLGCQGYWINADEERWLRAIIALQRGVDPAEMDDCSVSVQEIGASTAIADVVEIVGEGGDEREEDEE